MKTVLFDVDTQLDFLYPAGALAVPGGAALVSVLGELTRLAGARQYPVISTADAHAENDPEFSQWPPHCVSGTFGQMKTRVTLLPKVISLPNVRATDEQLRTAANSPQVVIEKQTIDCFTNVNLRPLLEAIQADRYVVYGVVAEICVAKAVFGLLETGKPVELVTDGTKALSDDEYRNMLAHFQAAGGRLTTLGELLQ
ncbi:MAG: cysteine hydrolase [Acidobacteriaceae bacterium]|nr:cysteine hydrolase [Acidobacteriaceae bacterium]